MTDHSYLVLHGWQNHRPADHWQHRLADALIARGLVVRYPQLPDADAPDPVAWEAVVRSELAALPDGPVTVVCHSLGSVLWLRLQSGDAPPRVDRVALVSPPSPELVAGQSISAFVAGDAFGGRLLPPGAAESVVVAGDDDEWLPLGLRDTWEARVDAPLHLVPRGGHLTPDTGFGPWPEMLSWALGADGAAGFGAGAE
ncbi:hypothetical protein ASF17_14275 [Frigoribacterium sp. Leaf263]|uniref:RBBP9/YdeN family alpha/beta hydrolase n=1 Tax=Frigoribacterium sp. Leaf263 TaxID=1736313 RepID=UPI0006FCE687|nr:alpha/beta hydrolase [Frigoribacterium sp. Leaf263]KQO80137.1 hypothetical protein ASF17_14275 [Frigoribacterium sp. Leaf263]